MQNRYTGDIGDYVKYGLLRTLSRERKLGVAWYLFPDENHNADGKHTDYLKHEKRWKPYDPELFVALKKIVREQRRKISAVEQSSTLPEASFFDELLNPKSIPVPERLEWRSHWFSRLQTTLKNCELIFADPDNGLCLNDTFSAGRANDWKRIPLSEAKALAEGRTAIIYHHNSRWKVAISKR